MPHRKLAPEGPLTPLKGLARARLATQDPDLFFPIFGRGTLKIRVLGFHHRAGS